MKLLSKSALASLFAAFALSGCSSDTTSEVTPENSTAVAKQPDKPSGNQIKASGYDISGIRQAASDALKDKDTSGARASAEKALDKHVPGDKRTDLIDKATEAARKKAKELGKEDQLDKARSMLDDFLKKKDS